MNGNDEITNYRTALIGLTAITNLLFQQKKPRKHKRPDLPWSETERLIDEWIHSELDRELLKTKLHDEDVTFEQLAERYAMSVQNVKRKFYQAKKRLYAKMKDPSR